MFQRFIPLLLATAASMIFCPPAFSEDLGTSNTGATISGGGTASSFSAAFPASGTAIGLKNGTNMVNATADGSNNLNVNCAVGCSASTSITGWAGSTLGTTAIVNYGSTPAATLVPGVNAFVTNTINAAITNTPAFTISGTLPAFAATPAVSVTGATTGGSTVYVADGGTGNALITAPTVTQIKATAGTAYRVRGCNSNTSFVYLQIFNAIPANVTLGTTPPFDVVQAMPSACFDELFTGDIGAGYATAISITATTTRTGTVAPVNAIDLSFYYK